MGLGKTIQAIGFMDGLMRFQKVRHTNMHTYS